LKIKTGSVTDKPNGTTSVRPSLSNSTLIPFSLAMLVVVTFGCANWKASEAGLSNTESALTDLGQSSRSPAIEVSFIGMTLDSEDNDRSDGIWQWVDETKIDAGQRRRLLANGIRVGFVSNEDQFRRRLESETVGTDVVDEFLSQASIKSDLSHGTERLPLRFGRRYELPLRQPVEGTEVTLLRIDGETIGQTLVRPQHILGVTAQRATSPNQIELLFRPEIQHGDAKQKWISSDSAFRIDTRRDTWSLPELDLSVNASESDLLVITADTPAHGLGKQMLTGSGSDQAQQQVLLLIDVAQVGTR
jgi:hypothetical protein